MAEALLGAVAMGFGLAGMFFLNFWRKTDDRLFLFFAAAFFVLAINRVIFMFFAPRDAHGDYPYWIRFIAFAIILAAILDKNFFRSREGRSPLPHVAER